MRRESSLSAALNRWRQQYAESDPPRKVAALYVISKEAEEFKNRYGEQDVVDSLQKLANNDHEAATQIIRVHLLDWRCIKRAVQTSKKIWRDREKEGLATEQTERGRKANSNGGVEVFSVTHLLMIAGVECESLQQKLLEQCSEQLWSVKKLRTEIGKGCDSATSESTAQDLPEPEPLSQYAALVGKQAAVLLDALNTVKPIKDWDADLSKLDIDEIKRALTELSESVNKLQAVHVRLAQVLHHCTKLMRELSRTC